MSTAHNDLRRLIEFSIEHGVEQATSWFPAFSPEQILGLYEISVSQRLQLLKEWGVESSEMSHFLRQFHDPHNPAQAAKIREQSSDPSNR